MTKTAKTHTMVPLRGDRIVIEIVEAKTVFVRENPLLIGSIRVKRNDRVTTDTQEGKTSLRVGPASLLRRSANMLTARQTDEVGDADMEVPVGTAIEVKITGRGNLVVGERDQAGNIVPANLLGALDVAISGVGNVLARSVGSLNVLIDGKGGEAKREDLLAYDLRHVCVDTVRGRATSRIPGEGSVRVSDTVEGDTFADLSGKDGEAYGRAASVSYARVLGDNRGTARSWGHGQCPNGGQSVYASTISPGVF